MEHRNRPPHGRDGGRRRDDRPGDKRRTYGDKTPERRPFVKRDQRDQPPPREFEQPVEEQADAPEFEERPARELPPLPQGVPLVHVASGVYGGFVYEPMVRRVEGNPADGDIVGVVDKYGKLAGWAFYNGRASLALRMISRAAERPGDDFLTARIADAVCLRRDVLKLDQHTTAYRLIHAEGDGLTGLVADRYDDYVVLEIFGLAMFQRLHRIEDAIVDAGLNVKSFVVRADKDICDAEGFILGRDIDRKDRTVTIAENGVRFNVRLATGHKTGFFCDQRDNRLALAQFTPGRSVLDCCCYTGGFACYAAGIGKAASVTAVDLDEVALETARENGKLNSARIEFKHSDAFDFLRHAADNGRKWDVVVVDPSKFVPKRAFMEQGLKKYLDLNKLAAGAVAPGGLLLTCSCSGLVDQATFVQTIARATRYAGREAQIIRVTGAGADHPFMANVPESAYLKAVWARLA